MVSPDRFAQANQYGYEPVVGHKHSATGVRTVRDLNYQLKRLCFDNRQGSEATQAARRHILNQIADQLHEMGYRKMSTRSLRPKHVEALVERWKEQELSTGTIKNRMNVLRWWAARVNRSNVIARSNDFYGIPNRSFVSQSSKAREIGAEQLAQIKDAYVAMSLRLQRAFGLRREEAIKFMPSYADRGDHLLLKRSWTKGGRPRVIPIRTDIQRSLLKQAHQLAGKGSLIPGTKNYVQQLHTYERLTSRAGLSKLHGLRHAYAQARYQELTGWPSPNAGGPSRSTLTTEQRDIDERSRLTVSEELGHSRLEITRVYLG